MMTLTFLLLLGVLLALLARYRWPVEKGWHCGQGALRTATITLCLLLSCFGIAQLQAAKLVLVVVDEHAAPVAGMEVIHTDLHGLKVVGSYDEKAGVYRFGDLVDGAGSVTAYKRNYRLAGVRWFLHTPDTVRIVSVKGGYLLYEERGVTYWYDINPRIVGISFDPRNTRNAEEVITKAGFIQRKGTMDYELRFKKKIGLFFSPALAMVLSEIKEAYIYIRCKEIQSKRDNKNKNRSSIARDPKITNRLKISFSYKYAMPEASRLKLLDSLMTQYGLVVNEYGSSNPTTLKDALEESYNELYVAIETGMGACVIDQLNFLLDCPMILDCEIDYPTFVEPANYIGEK